MDADVRAVIERLDLAPHPEGGWYRETWRAEAGDGERGACTSILFLLEPAQHSHWHRVDATEIWLHQGGGHLTLSTEHDGQVVATRLGPDWLSGDVLQAVVQPGQWQAARAGDRWALVACVVAPAFEFAGFELAPTGWRPGPPTR